MSNTDELSQSVSKLVELNRQIKEARSDIKILADAEKALKSQIKKLMIDNGLDVINLKKGKNHGQKECEKGWLKQELNQGRSRRFLFRKRTTSRKCLKDYPR